MEKSALLRLIEQGETTRVEFKESITSLDRLSAEIVAFSNSQGGKILVGIADKGNIKGLEKDALKRAQESVMNVAANCRPPVSVLTEVISVEEKDILIVHIPKTLALHRDKKHDIWVRSGPNKRKVIDDAEFSRLMQEKRLVYADRQAITTAGIDDLDILSFKKFYRKRFNHGDIDAHGEVKRVLKNIKLLEGDHPTLASLLLFGIHNDCVIPQFLHKGRMV